MIEDTILGMLKENTGIALCDSGGDGGRMWQKNAKKTREDFEKEPVVEFDMDFGDGDILESSDISFVVSLYHYLPMVLEEDDTCEEFNALPVKDWDGEAYGVSKRGERFLKKAGFEYGESWNTYNGEDFLSQTLQGTNLKRYGESDDYNGYVLVQVHGGADVRGGYTDAKLFKQKDMLHPCPTVYGEITRGEETLEVSTQYDGVSLLDEAGLAITIQKTDEVRLFLLNE